MEKYLSDIQALELLGNRRKKYESPAKSDETSAFRRIAGALMWDGKATLPPTSLARSLMQQQIGILKVRSLIQANHTLKELKDLSPVMKFPAMNSPSYMQIPTYSDASFNINSRQVYGHTGIISSIEVFNKEFPNLFFPINWSSVNQLKVTHSSYGSEIVAAADADYRGLYLKMILADLGSSFNLDNVLIVDSKSLSDTIKTLYENRENRFPQTVQRIRYSFESRDISAIRWIQTFANLAEALTQNATLL